MNEQIDQMAQELEIPEFLKRDGGSAVAPVVNDDGGTGEVFVQTDEEVPAEVLQ